MSYFTKSQQPELASRPAAVRQESVPESAPAAVRRESVASGVFTGLVLFFIVLPISVLMIILVLAQLAGVFEALASASGVALIVVAVAGAAAMRWARRTGRRRPRWDSGVVLTTASEPRAEPPPAPKSDQERHRRMLEQFHSQRRGEK